MNLLIIVWHDEQDVFFSLKPQADWWGSSSPFSIVGCWFDLKCNVMFSALNRWVPRNGAPADGPRALSPLKNTLRPEVIFSTIKCSLPGGVSRQLLKIQFTIWNKMFTSCNFYRYLCQENDVVALVLLVSDAAPLCPSSGLQGTLARFYGQGLLLHGLTLSLQNFNCLFQADNGGPLSRRPCTALSCPPRPAGRGRWW